MHIVRAFASHYLLVPLPFPHLRPPSVFPYSLHHGVAKLGLGQAQACRHSVASERWHIAHRARLFVWAGGVSPPLGSPSRLPSYPSLTFLFAFLRNRAMEETGPTRAITRHGVSTPRTPRIRGLRRGMRSADEEIALLAPHPPLHGSADLMLVLTKNSAGGLMVWVTMAV